MSLELDRSVDLDIALTCDGLESLHKASTQSPITNNTMKSRVFKPLEISAIVRIVPHMLSNTCWYDISTSNLAKARIH